MSMEQKKSGEQATENQAAPVTAPPEWAPVRWRRAASGERTRALLVGRVGAINMLGLFMWSIGETWVSRERFFGLVVSAREGVKCVERLFRCWSARLGTADLICESNRDRGGNTRKRLSVKPFRLLYPDIFKPVAPMSPSSSIQHGSHWSHRRVRPFWQKLNWLCASSAHPLDGARATRTRKWEPSDTDPIPSIRT